VAKIITVEIDEAGDQTVDLAGYQGKGCAAVQAVFERAVGKSTSVVRKPEYNKATVKDNVLKR
jgi:hypothetical protein